MNISEAKEKLMELQSVNSAYDHALGILHFDGVTTAPVATAANRARSMSVLTADSYKRNTSKETVELLEYLDSHSDELDEKEKRMVELMIKDLRKMEKIPMDFYVGHRKLLVESADAWHRAKEKDDFSIFEPILEKVYDDAKKIAEFVSPGMDPFDYWLNESEEGLSDEFCKNFFDTVKAEVVPMIKAIAEKPQVDKSVITGYFPEYKQRQLSSYLMDVMGFDKTHVGLATTEHPFTTSLGSQNDVRLTTHYYEDNFAPAMFSVIHEGGHGLYFAGPNREFAYTVLDGGASMSMHESQSRFYENYIGRSRGFIELIFPKIAELFPESCKGKTPEDLYRAVNRVEPGLIRITADEVTYTLHIVIRHEVERRIFAGDVKIHDVPALWNSLYKEYLGIDVPSDRFGCLQDSHWGSGQIGYFPSYSLGSAYGAQFMAKMRETVDVDACLAKGDLAPISEWNREKIWQYGQLYPPTEILDRVFEGPFDPHYFTDYLKKKYTDIYGL